jgi:hypothetical protein
VKVCSKCGLEKTKESFSSRLQNKDGLRSECKVCQAEYHKKRYQDPRVKELGKIASRKFSMKQLGIDQDQIDHFYKLQGNRCAICRVTEEEHGKLLALDHNHENGKARGLLCQQCNTGLGNFRDNVGLLTAAICYLAVTP